MFNNIMYVYCAIDFLTPAITRNSHEYGKRTKKINIFSVLNKQVDLICSMLCIQGCQSCSFYGLIDIIYIYIYIMSGLGLNQKFTLNCQG